MSESDRIRVSSGDEVPSHWSFRTLQELVPEEGVFSDGDWVESKDQDPDGRVRLIQLADIGDGRFKNKSDRYLTEKKASELNCTFINKNDVLIARMPDPLGRACLFPGDRKTCCTVVDVCIVRTGESGADHRWLMHAINSPQFRRTIASLQSGTTRKRISRKNLARIEFPLPPLPEQRRIVAKIEELFSNLDAGMGELSVAEQQLERYRLSVLQAAVEGRLTADWRRTHTPEPADQLLERIEKAHRNQWEVEYRWRRYDAKDKEPPSGWKSRYSPPESLSDVSDLFSIPNGWKWVRSEQICGFITKGTTPKSEEMKSGDGEIPFIKVYNLTKKGKLDFTIDPTFVDRETHKGKLARSRLLPGDVIMNIVGPPLGQVAVVPDDHREWNMNQAVVKYRPLAGVDRQYIAYALRAKSILNWAISKRKATAGQFNLTLAICRDLPVPLPPLVEQEQIVAEVERLLSVADDVSATTKQEQTCAERLRQSILKQAFSGKLVPHEAEHSAPETPPTPAARVGEQMEMGL